MEFLRLLEGIRTPVITTFMDLITYCGSEIFFMALAITVFWCVNKRDGYYILLVGFLGTVGNQFLKLWFRIPRPWVLDPNFTVVESARAGATGYSFPSGHTQNIVGTMTCVTLMTKRKGIRAAAIALMLLVPFSRMYLGCHTPLDVGVSFILALALAIALRPVILADERSRRSAQCHNSRPMRSQASEQGSLSTQKTPMLWGLLFLSLFITALYWAFVTFYHFPADIDSENFYEGTKNAYTLFGCLAGLIVSKTLDDRYIHFEVKAAWPAQIAKVLLGLLLIIAIRAGLKAPLQAILPEFPATAVRYCIMVIFAGAVWPLTFSRFARIGNNRD